MPEITQATQKFISQYQTWYQSLQPKEGVPTIHADEVASKVATFYEKIRGVVDWKEEHLMRRVAMERILKRRLFLQNSDHAAEPFLSELIRGGHFPNDTIPKSKIPKIQKIIDKYTFIFNNSPTPPKNKIKSQLYTQLLEIAACEIEETVDSPSYVKANALIEYMETVIKERIKIGGRALTIKGVVEEGKNTLTYIAVQQALLNLDPPIITYNLLKRKYPAWKNLEKLTLQEITKNIYIILGNIEKYFSHPLAGKFYKVCERYDTPFLLLNDVLSENQTKTAEEIFQPQTLEKSIKKVYNTRLNTLKRRLARAAFYSTLSIFLTNIFSLYLLEFPFTKYVMGQIHTLAAVLDVAGPTFLMFLLVITIRPPKPKNLKLVIEETKKNVYEEQSKDLYEIELYPKKSFILRLVIALLYLLSFGVCYGAIIWVLYKLEYPPLSYILLIAFTSLIAFAGTKIRQRAKELHVTKEKESFLHILIDPLSIPVIRLGKWLSARWKKYNILAVGFNLLIDTPFIIFVEFLEQWRYFLKEKKEEIR